MKNEARRPPKCENWAQGSAKVSPRAPKGSQKRDKWSQKGAKGNQKGGNGMPKGSQREPKVSPIQYKINIKDKVAKRSREGSEKGPTGHEFLESFSMKNRWKNRCENRYRKSHENWWNFDAKMKPDLDTFRRSRSWKNVFSWKGGNALYTSRLQ